MSLSIPASCLKKSPALSNVSLIFSSSLTTIPFALCEGGTFIEDLTFLTALTASFISSALFSSSVKLYSAFSTGQGSIIMVFTPSLTVQYISSVIKGMKGCKSLSMLLRTYISTASAVSLVSSSLFQSLTFTISIYQSQNSSHAKS